MRHLRLTWKCFVSEFDKKDISLIFKLMIVHNHYICFHTCKHMKDTCEAPGNSLDVFSAPKIPRILTLEYFCGHLFNSYFKFIISFFLEQLVVDWNT